MPLTLDRFAVNGAASRIGPAIGLALLSGILSGALDDRLVVRDQPLFPGLAFAAALTLLVGAAQRPRRSRLLALFAGVLVAWLCAYNATMLSEKLMTQIARALAGAVEVPGDSSVPRYTFALMGLVGGFVGSVLTCIAISIAAPSFRTPENWARTIAVGFVAGALLETMNAQGAIIHTPGTYAVFVVWQCAVAVSIAYGLRTAEQSSPIIAQSA